MGVPISTLGGTLEPRLATSRPLEGLQVAPPHESRLSVRAGRGARHPPPTSPNPER